MKIAILTIHDFNNYGNRLQNYATHTILVRMGISAETLVIEDVKTIKRILSSIIRKVCYMIFPQLYVKWNPISAKWTRFELFTKKYIPENIVYSKNRDVSNSVINKYDYFLVGSDQVWNPTFSNVQIGNFLLEFANSSRRISFAASFGMDYLSDEWFSQYASELLKFKAISVRENRGAEIIKELIGKDVSVLIDPTLLLSANDWRKIAKPVRIKSNKPYILTCFLGEKSKLYTEIIEKIAVEYSLDIKNLCDKNDLELFQAGPAEYLYLLDHAAFICSDSFHTAVFSVLFDKPFLILNRIEHNEICPMNSRIETFLNKVNLKQKLQVDINNSMLFDCDYHSAHEILECERIKAMHFLENALFESN